VLRDNTENATMTLLWIHYLMGPLTASPSAKTQQAYEASFAGMRSRRHILMDRE
jgi:hypothetical protein